MDVETLTIGGLTVVLEYGCGTQARVAWDLAHREFVTPGTAASTVACRLRVEDRSAPAGEHAELLADGRLWTLRRDPATLRQRIAVHGCPQGPLSLTVDLAPPRPNAPLAGTLFLGPPPPGCARVPLGYPLMPLLWTLLSGHVAPQDAALLCHACGVVTPGGEGLLFAGFSGAGKSTTSRLWRMACPDAVILSDDRVLLRRDVSSPTGFAIYGTPWHGDAEEVSPAHAPLRRVLILGRSPDGIRNDLVPLIPATAAAQLLARTTPPIWDALGTTHALALAADACASVFVARWDFAPTAEAVRQLLALSPGIVPHRV